MELFLNVRVDSNDDGISLVHFQRRGTARYIAILQRERKVLGDRGSRGVLARGKDVEADTTDDKEEYEYADDAHAYDFLTATIMDIAEMRSAPRDAKRGSFSLFFGAAGVFSTTSVMEYGFAVCYPSS
mgnify:CR=1 FL=1